MADDIVTRLELEAAEWRGFCEDIHLPILEAAEEIRRLRTAGDDIADLLTGIASNRLTEQEQATVGKYISKWQHCRG